MSDTNYWPVASFYFIVIVDGEQVSFQEVSGLEIQVELEDNSGGTNSIESGAPVKRKLSNITLKRGVIKKGSGFHSWVVDAFHPDEGQSKVSPKNALVMLLDENGIPTLVWNIIGAYPIKWSFSALNSEKNEALIETVELTVRDVMVIPTF